MGYTRCFQILASCPIVSMIYCRMALLTAVSNHEPMVHSQSVLRSRFIFLLCNLLQSRRSVPITSVKKYKAVFPIPQAQKLRSLLKAGTVLLHVPHPHPDPVGTPYMVHKQKMKDFNNPISKIP